MYWNLRKAVFVNWKKNCVFWNTISTRAVPQCLLYFAKTGIYQTSNDLEVDFALGILSISLPLLGSEANTLIGPNVHRLRGKHYVKWITTILLKGDFLPVDLEIFQEGRQYL